MRLICLTVLLHTKHILNIKLLLCATSGSVIEFQKRFLQAGFNRVHGLETAVTEAYFLALAETALLVGLGTLGMSVGI